MTDIEALKAAIRKGHGCEAEHIETQAVVETFRGQTVWSGEVEVFRLIDHPKASTAYGWKDAETGRFIAVLGVPPIDSALASVRAFVAHGSAMK